MKKIFIIYCILVCNLYAQAPGNPRSGAIQRGQYAVLGPDGTFVGSFGPTPTLTNTIVSGCGVTYSGSGLVFDVAACVYNIAGVRYTSPAVQVTLSAANGSNPRVDSIIVNTSSVGTKVDGTAAIAPVAPVLDQITQLRLQDVRVETSATTPGSTFVTNVYLENTEWTCTASDGSNVMNSTNNPYAGTKDIEGTSVSSGDYFECSSTAVTIGNYLNLGMFYRQK